LGKLVSESGFAYHTVSSKELTESEAKHIHLQSLKLSLWIGLIAGVGAACFASPSIADRLLRAAIATLSVWMAGFTAVPVAWAQRKGYFGALEWWGVGAQAVATFCVAIPLALLHMRLAAASTNLLVPVLISAGVAWRVASLAGHSPTVAHIPRLYRFGSLVSNCGSYAAGNVDTLLLATYLPIVDLGIYSRANMLASLPGTVVTAAIARIGLLSLSKSDKWSENFRFLSVATGITLLVFSGQILLAVFGLNVTALAFGPKFTTDRYAFALLTASQIFFYSVSLLNTYIIVRKKPIIVGISQVSQAIVTGILFLVIRPKDLWQISWILLIPAAVNYCVIATIVYLSRHQLMQDVAKAVEPADPS
jgi:O-antigen/teichoic acid export membrane protein